MKNLQPNQLVRINSDLWPTFNGLYRICEGSRSFQGVREHEAQCLDGYNRGEFFYISEKFLSKYGEVLTDLERDEVFNERVRRFKEANRKGIIAQYGSMKAFKEANHG